jgi:ribosome-binding factor A
MSLEPRKAHIQTEYLAAVRNEIARWISENAYHNSLITVTKCELSEFGGRVTVFVSVFPEHGMTGALSMLTRHGREIAERLGKQFRHRRKPFLLFESDVASSTHNLIETATAADAKIAEMREARAMTEAEMSGE